MKREKNKFSDDGTYISNDVLKKLSRRKKIQLFAGGFFGFFHVYGVIIGLMGTDEALREDLLLNVFMAALFTLVILCGIRNSKRISLMHRYDSIFMCDVDGTVTIDEIARRTGKQPHQILLELEKLFNIGAFRDCTIQKEENPGVILSGRSGSETSFVAVVCENCSGTTRLRAGTSGKCEYCGSAISARKTHR